jgi:hypothetical protein
MVIVGLLGLLERNKRLSTTWTSLVLFLHGRHRRHRRRMLFARTQGWSTVSASHVWQRRLFVGGNERLWTLDPIIMVVFCRARAKQYSRQQNVA